MVKVPEILLIEDDLFTSRLLKKYFENRGIVTHQAFDIGAGYNKALEHNIATIVLDLSLPSGLSVDAITDLKNIASCPIIIYTSNKQIEMELKTLNLGVDDFLMKERGIEVLYNRVKRLLIKHSMPDVPVDLLDNFRREGIVSVGKFDININSQCIIYNNDMKIDLTKKEAHLLFYLAKNKNVLVGRDQLSFIIKGYAHDGWSRSIDLIICRLRNKIENQKINDSINIKTVRGKGYLLSEN
ncbi:response regulator transcription factor [Vibrio sp. YMD68]|uniref:response regulator transcription factor n=1 Tax=Vibrio sp. YMD68 TaxID=3042300 RepID=UPI00249AEA44|nr:response regulator transcription factor [Vibrio sp. YMD68]WGW01359.1 response regulator transcription factor [Vibrio sp. YMD68]